jgi:hypothetical protein
VSDLKNLKKDRDAIIARLDMTRQRYRAEMLINRRLAASGHHEDENLRFAHGIQPEGFPRSVTIRMLQRHPYLAAAAVAVFAMLGPRAIVRTASRAALPYATSFVANSKYGPLLARVMPYVKMLIARREATMQRRAARHADHAAARPDYQTRNYAHAAGDQHFDQAVHHEHLQTTPTIH